MPRSEPPDPDPNGGGSAPTRRRTGKPRATPYERAIRTIPFLCGGGWLVAVVGYATKIVWLQKTGLGCFLGGFAVWGLANGGGFVWAMREALRKDGRSTFTENPWSSALFVLLMGFFLGMGMFFVWFIVRILMS